MGIISGYYKMDSLFRIDYARNEMKELGFHSDTGNFTNDKFYSFELKKNCEFEFKEVIRNSIEVSEYFGGNEKVENNKKEKINYMLGKVVKVLLYFEIFYLYYNISK